MLSTLKKPTLTIAPYLLVFAIWYYFAVLHAIPYWQEGGDYSWYSLSQALTLESLVERHPAFNIGYSVHPGIPFGILSWVALRLSALGQASGAPLINFAIDHAESYWSYAKALALLLDFAGIYFLQRLLGRNTAAFWLGFAAFFAMVTAAFSTSLVQLTNESFTLPFVVGFYFLVFRFFYASDRRQYLPDGLIRFEGLSERDILALAAGAGAAFGCSIKVYYLAPAVGFAVGILAAAALGILNWRIAAKSCALSLAGFVALGAVIVTATIRWRGLVGLVGFDWDMLTHVGRYASGNRGFASMDAVEQAFLDLSRSSDLRFPIILLSLSFAFLFVVARNLKTASWRQEYLPFCVSVSVGLLINLTGLLKHYSPLSQHYALPVCATLPCLLVIFDSDTLGRRFVKLWAFVAVALFVANVAAYFSENAEKLEVANTVVADNKAIDALPILPGQKRVWGYFSPTEAGELPYVSQYSGSAFVDRVLFGSKPRVDIAAVLDPGATNWKYVIFPKKYFPTMASIRPVYRTQFDFASTKFQILDSDKITELKNFFLLTRSDAALAVKQ